MNAYDTNGIALETVYDIEGTELTDAYDVEGRSLSKAVDYDNYTISNYCTVSLTPTQGFDIYNGIIFQFLASSTVSNKMATVNASNSSIVSNNVVCVSDHGDSASFSDEKYSDNDDFPLLYVTSDTYPKVYINRVTTTTSELIKTLYFPIENAGYMPALAYDKANNIAYMVGYSEDNYQTDDGGNNKTVISKWDMSELTQNQDGSYTPAFISSTERPFIYVMQGIQWHDGMIWVASGATNTRGYVYALNPVNGNLLYTIDTNTTTELEGIAFLPDGNMVFGLQGGTYKKVTFEQDIDSDIVNLGKADFMKLLS